MKILIVDDEAMQRDVLSGFLKNKGYNVLTAADGREALKIFEREPVHLVIMDYKMPGLTGDEVLEKMKAINPM
ncbi:MAG: response regulator, partial [Deltaproteobacteria bacterium]|nr:response regulator [Deltaproteobacteria bacterium]